MHENSSALVLHSTPSNASVVLLEAGLQAAWKLRDLQIVLSRWCFGARGHKETELAQQVDARVLQFNNLQREHTWLQGEHDQLAAAQDRPLIVVCS